MIGLQTTRVLVVDDEKVDGFALVQAFSRMGIGAAYFTGQEDDLTEGRLKGMFKSVRLIALDMILNEAVTGDISAQLQPAVLAVDNLLSDNHRPFVIIAWTGRNEGIVKEFEGLLRRARKDLAPFLILKLAKNEVIAEQIPAVNATIGQNEGQESSEGALGPGRVPEEEAPQPQTASETSSAASENDQNHGEAKQDFGGTVVSHQSRETGEGGNAVGGEQRPGPIGGREFDIEAIMDRLKAQLEQWFPLDLILHWEQGVHDGAAATLAMLFDMVSEPWNQELERILLALVKASGGKTVSDGPFALRSLLEALNLIHQDHMEQWSYRVPDDETNATRLVQSKKVTLAAPSRGMLNRRLMVDVSAPGRLLPGNVYVRDAWDPPDQFPVGQGVVQVTSLIDDVFDGATNDEAAVLNKHSVALLVEMNPSCDHAQAKVKYARLMPGLLIPEFFCERAVAKKCGKQCEALAKKFKKDASFMMIAGPLNFQGTGLTPLTVNYVLVLDSHYVLGMSCDDLQQQREAFRLRSQLLVDIQSKFASHAARPGYVSV